MKALTPSPSSSESSHSASVADLLSDGDDDCGGGAGGRNSLSSGTGEVLAFSCRSWMTSDLWSPEVLPM